MTGDLLQQLVVLAIVLGALGFVAVKVVRTVRSARAKRDAACGSACGCGPAPSQPRRPSS